jgi:hypothetical protein
MDVLEVFEIPQKAKPRFPCLPVLSQHTNFQLCRGEKKSLAIRSQSLLLHPVMIMTVEIISRVTRSKKEHKQTG